MAEHAHEPPEGRSTALTGGAGDCGVEGSGEVLALLAALHADCELSGSAHVGEILAGADERTRVRVAGCVVYGSDSALRVLALDPAVAVRAAAAANPPIHFGDRGVLLGLACDEPEVAAALARNPLTAGDPVVQPVLAVHPDPRVRSAVLDNEPCPRALEILRGDPDHGVRARAASATAP
jgi:hypothetical protein